MKKLLLLLLVPLLLNGCSILSKVYVRNYYDKAITVSVENLWFEGKEIRNTKDWAMYTPRIIDITNTSYNKLNDSLEMFYNANGMLKLTIPPHSTVLLETMHNAAPTADIKVKVFESNNIINESKLAEYTTKDVKYKSFHKYYLDIKP
jgi:uncharacterized protein YcfL